MTAVFGREREVERARQFLSSVRDGFGALLVEGEPGIGKTTVWGEAVRLAEEEGYLVLRSRPAQAEAKLAFASLADLLAPVGDEVLSALPEPQRLALGAALLRSGPHRSPSEPRAIATGLQSVLSELAAESRVLVAVDDVQWLDRASATALAFALRRFGRDRPLALLAALRIEAGGAADPLGLAELPPERLGRMRLGPLGLAALHHLVAVRLGRALPRRILTRVQQQAGGNPLFALELARALEESGSWPGPGEPLPVPRGLAALLGARAARLSAGAREAVLVVALLADAASATVERALGPDAEKALEEAARAGVLEVRGERICLGHPLYGAVVAQGALPARRRALHHRLSGLVEDPEERARHLALAATQPDEEVVRLLDEGSAHARSRGAWAAAGELLERAQELTPPELAADARRRAIAAAEHHVYAGDRTRARELLEAVLAEPLHPPERAEALRLLAEISCNDESFGQAARLFAAARDHTQDPRGLVTIELGLAYVHSNLMEWSRAREHAQRALARAEEVGDRLGAGQALAHCAMMDFLCGGGVDWDKVQRSLELDDHSARVALVRRPSTLAAFLLLYVGRHEEARERIQALCAAARERGDESDLAFVLLWLSWLETRAGDLVSAAAIAEEAASLGALTGSRSMHAWALTQRAYVEAHRGDVAATRALCAEAAGPVRESGNLLPELWIGAALALLELSLGNAEAAWRACEALVLPLERKGVSEPVTAFFLPDAIEALIALGQQERVEALLALFERRARELERGWALATSARCRGLLLAARGDAAGAQVALARALDEHERLGMPFERARTLLAAGVVERRAGRRRSARASLAAARAEFGRLGARLWQERAAAELARVPIRREASLVGLTASEERVAELVARGWTNREVAGTLFVSDKTVEANLTRIYRKLGVRSRAGLAARMAGRANT